MTAGTEPLTERPAWKALKAHIPSVPRQKARSRCWHPGRSIDGMRPPKVRFATDSLLEGQGFEPSVPRERD